MLNVLVKRNDESRLLSLLFSLALSPPFLLFIQLKARLQEEIRKRIEYAVKVVSRANDRQKIIDGVVMKERTALS